MRSQNEAILAYMETFGSITPLEAFADIGCMRLASRLSDLRRQGHRIKSGMVTGMNRLNRRVSYARYTLEDTG